MFQSFGIFDQPPEDKLDVAGTCIPNTNNANFHDSTGTLDEWIEAVRSVFWQTGEGKGRIKWEMHFAPIRLFDHARLGYETIRDHSHMTSSRRRRGGKKYKIFRIFNTAV